MYIWQVSASQNISRNHHLLGMHACQLALRVHEHSVENSIASYPRWLGMQEAIKYCCVYNESVIWRCVQDVAAAAATEETAVRGGGWGAGGGVVSVRTIIINIIRNLSCHHHHQHNHHLHQKHHHHHRQQRRHHHRQHHHHHQHHHHYHHLRRHHQQYHPRPLSFNLKGLPLMPCQDAA